MQTTVEPVARLIEELARLPGIGPKTAQRLTFHLLRVPTETARAVIAEVEGLDRGRYAGPVGWLDARGDGEWGIALRCAEVDPDDPRRLRLFAGCGIVAGSLPEQELAESAAKLVPVRDALQA